LWVKNWEKSTLEKRQKESHWGIAFKTELIPAAAEGKWAKSPP